MPRPVGRPKESHGPKKMMIVHVPALMHAQVQATAKGRGVTMSQVIRDVLAREWAMEWEAE